MTKLFLFFCTKLSVYLFLGLSIFIHWILYHLKYEFVVNNLIHFFEIPANYYPNIKEKFFTATLFQGLKIVFLLITNLCLADFFLNKNQILKKIWLFFYNFFQKLVKKFQIKKRFLALTFHKIREKPQKFIFYLCFFLIIFLVWGYHALYFPALEDELFAYTFLIHRGFLVNIFYYPGPNHHVFFDILGCFLDNFSVIFFEKYHILRLISVVSMGILGVKFADYLHKYLEKNLFLEDNLRKKITYIFAFATVGGLFFVQSPIFLMSFLGRGYALQMLIGVILVEKCVCLTDFLSKRITNFNKNCFKNPKINAISAQIIFYAVLGFYTIPTFLYIWGSVLVYLTLCYFLSFRRNMAIFLGKKEDIKCLKFIFWINIQVIFWVFLVYSPIFLVSGFGSVLGNDWVKSLTYFQFFNGFPSFLYKVFDYLFPVFPYFFGISLLILGIFSVFFLAKNKKILYFSLLFTPILMIFLQKVLPPERIFSYYYLIFLAILVDFLVFFHKKFYTKKTIYIGFYLFLSIFFGVEMIFFEKNAFPKIHFEESDYRIFAKNTLKKHLELIQTSGEKLPKMEIFAKDLSYKTYIMYEYTTQRKDLLPFLVFL